MSNYIKSFEVVTSIDTSILKELTEISTVCEGEKEDFKRDVLSQIQVEFMLEGINRFQSMLLAELKGSYVQQSQRYVKMSIEDVDYPKDEMKKSEIAKANELIERSFDLYKRMTELNGEIKGRPNCEDFKYGIPYEDARYILPLAVTTNMQVSLNGYQLLELFRLESKYPMVFDVLVRELINKLGEHNLWDIYLVMNNVAGIDEIFFFTKYKEKNLFNLLYFDYKTHLSKENNLLVMGKNFNPTKSIARGALASTLASSPTEAVNKRNNDSLAGTVKRVLGYGHTSIAEQDTIISGMYMSLVTYHQFVRHRLANNIRDSFSAIVDDNSLEDIIIPPSIKNNKQFLLEFKALALDYITFRKSLNNESKLFFLINADGIRLVNKTNARIDIDIAKERTCLNAQWEIQELYEKKISKLISYSPEVFKSAVPSCVFGICKEGKLSCGHAKEVRARYLDN